MSSLVAINFMIIFLNHFTADPNKGDRYHVTPLHCAALSGHDKCVSLLIDAGANVNASTLNYDRIGVHQSECTLYT